MIKMTVSQTCSNVMVGNQTSQSFHVGVVVRQGDALLSTLFNLVLHTAIQDFSDAGDYSESVGPIVWLCRCNCSDESQYCSAQGAIPSIREGRKDT